jgi:hypothetical protein
MASKKIIDRCHLDYRRCGKLCRECPTPNNPIHIRAKLTHTNCVDFMYKTFSVPDVGYFPDREFQFMLTNYRCSNHKRQLFIISVIEWWHDEFTRNARIRKKKNGISNRQFIEYQRKDRS